MRFMLSSMSKRLCALGAAAAIASLSSSAWAQELYPVTIGQNQLLEVMNHQDHTTGPDSGNGSAALAADLTASSVGNTATAHVRAIDDEAAVASAKVGVKFDLLLPQGVSWDEVKDEPVWVTLELDYALDSSYAPQSGSANAGLAIRPLTSGPWHDFVGFAANGAGTSGGPGLAIRFQTTPQKLGDTIELEAMAQAHASATNGPNEATASVTLRSVLFDFVPKKSFSVRFESKLYINDIGWFDCGNPNFINPADYTLSKYMARRAAYQSFCMLTSLGEEPPNGDLIEPLDARIRAGVDVRFTCEAGRAMPIDSDITSLPTGSGWEGGIVKGISNPTATRNDLTTNGTFAYVASGHPHPIIEPSFQVFKQRANTDIWHRVSGTVTCGSDAAGYPTASVDTRLTRTWFPSHRVFFRTPRDAPSFSIIFDQPQRLFSDLWRLPPIAAP